MTQSPINDRELSRQLSEFGYSYPVTPTTRKVLQNKLESLVSGRTATNKSTFTTHATPTQKTSSGNQTDTDLQLLFFDLETSGLRADCDVLQIAVKGKYTEFSRYIKPTQEIPEDTTKINNLWKRGDELYFMNNIVPTRPVRLVLEELLAVLQSFGKPCVLVAHNCSFDASRLMRIIKQESMEQAFSSVIAGFTDTLAMFRQKFPKRRWKGACTLSTLASETVATPLDTTGVHDALFDAKLLEKLALHHFTVEQLLARRVNFGSSA